jgi:hypothetical protein
MRLTDFLPAIGTYVRQRSSEQEVCMPKAKTPEWLNAEIQELYQSGHRAIKAIQRAVQDKRGVEIPYMTISNRMDDLGLARPRKPSKRTEEDARSEPTTEKTRPDDVTEPLP